MSDSNPSSSFPSTQRDISNLKQTATDAATDLAGSAADHASKARGQFKELAGDLQEEGTEKLNQVNGQLCSVLHAAADCVSARPLACMGVALAIGYLYGLSRRAASSR